MAHNLAFDEKSQEYAMFSRKEIPWHRLGQVVPEALTSEEAIRQAHLDYKVELFPLLARIDENHLSDVPEKFATVRTDTHKVLGVVGNRYEIVQNTQAFDFVDHIVGSKEAVFETAGALGGGEKIFVTAKLPTFIRLGDTDDIIEEYLLFSNAHDGSGSVVGGFTTVRVVCNNTYSLALKNLKNRFTIRHTASVHDKIKKGIEIMGLQRMYHAEFKEQINLLAKLNITEERVDKTARQILMTPQEILAVESDGIFTEDLSTRKRNLYFEMRDHIEKGPGQDLHRGTGLWLFNGVTSYFSNAKKYKDEEKRFAELTSGWVNNQTQNVFNELLAEV